MKFVDKNHIVDAFRWTGDINQTEDPCWIVEALKEKRVWFKGKGTPQVTLCLRDGDAHSMNHRTANRGDWIIRLAHGYLMVFEEAAFKAVFRSLPENKELEGSFT